MISRFWARANELRSARQPFVYATVVRAQSPTSSRPGDDAVILSDGTIEGFVGGQCAEESVRLTPSRSFPVASRCCYGAARRRR